MLPAGTSAVTTAPAPTRAFFPMVRPASMVAFEPMLAPVFTTVGMTSQSASDCGDPSLFVACGYLSFVNITPCPTNTLSSIVTPSQRNECDEILQRRPIFTPFWISTNAPTRDSSPISQPYALTKE